MVGGKGKAPPFTLKGKCATRHVFDCPGIEKLNSASWKKGTWNSYCNLESLWLIIWEWIKFFFQVFCKPKEPDLEHCVRCNWLKQSVSMWWIASVFAWDDELSGWDCCHTMFNLELWSYNPSIFMENLEDIAANLLCYSIFWFIFS